MIISTVLRLMRGAAKASLKAGKFAIDTSGKLVKTGARTAKHINMTPEEKKAAKKNEKRKDKSKKTVKKTGGAAVKVTGRVISEGFILLVGLIEDFFVLLIIVLLILALILVVCVVTIFGTFSGVISSDISSTSTGSSSYSFGGSKTRTAVKITDPTTYDWWGNKDQNMLLLTDNKDKELYQIIACNFELQKYGLNTNDNLYWNAGCGIGLLLSEGGGGLYYANMTMHDGSDSEKNAIINDKCNYVFAYVSPSGTVDDYGNGPTGLSWGFASDKSYDFGPFSVKNVNKEYLQDSRNKAAAHVEASGNTLKHKGGSYSVDVSAYSDNEAYAQWTLPGGLKFAYDGSRTYSYDDVVISSNKTTIGDIFDRWEIEKTSEHLTSIAWADYYCRHHGEGDPKSNEGGRAYVIEYMCALYQFADKNLNNINYVDSSGNLSTACVTEGHGHMMEFLQTPVSQSSSANIQVIHDGKKKVYDYESGDTLAKDVLNWAKNKYADGYTHLKEALDWAQFGAPEYRAGGTGVAFSSFRSNLVACMGVYFSGQTVVSYMVDKLGIVFESEEDSDGTGSISFSKAATKTQANLKDTMLMHYVKGGVTSSNISADFLADVEAYKKANSSVVRDKEYTVYTNPWLQADWCAATVKGLMKDTKLGTSNKTLLGALTEKGKYPDTSSNFANLGVGGVARGSTGEQSTSCAEGYSPYIKVHFTNKSNIRSAFNGEIGKFPLVASSPQVASYKSDGRVIVSKESLYTPKPGDVIIYSFDNYGWSHVGFCYDYDSSSNIITTVEGNTGANTSSGAYGYTSHSFNYKDNQSLAWIVEIDYVGLEKACGVSSTSSTTDKSGVFKVDSFVKDKIKTGLKSLDSKTKKFIDVSVNGTSCKVTTYEKSANDKWDIGPVSLSEGYVGSKGLASAASNSYEGSNMTPYGTYYCRIGFGNGTKDSLGIKMSTWYNIGDGGMHIWSGSGTSAGFDGGEGIEINKYYNKSINGGTGAENLTSYVGYAYKYAMFIEYNSGKTAKPGGGSAFFLHVGSQPTAGCIAISDSDMLKIAKWADDNTVICIHNSNEVIGRQSSKQTSNNS